MSFSDLFRLQKNSLENRVKTLFENPPELCSERLRFVKITPEYAADMYAYSQNPEVTKYLTWSPHSSLKETEHYVKLLQKKYEAGVFNDWGLVEKASGRLIGTCGFTSFDYKNNTSEIGYVLSEDFWGKGLAVEAASTVMRFGFKEFGLNGFCAKFIEGNDASMRVMQKLGMSLEGVYRNSMFIKGSYKTIVVYRITRDEFFAKFGE